MTGVELVRRKLHQYQDKKRTKAFLNEKDRLKEQQEKQHAELQRRHAMPALDLQRKVRALGQVEKREFKSLEESLLKEQRIRARSGRDQMPSLSLELRDVAVTDVKDLIDKEIAVKTKKSPATEAAGPR